MRPSEFKVLIKAFHNIATSKTAVLGSKRPLMVESSPGLGKTQIVAQAAAELGIGFKAIHAPLMQPEDYGMPVVHGKDKDQLKFVVSAEKFPLEGSACPEFGILLIDEMPQADNSTQKILANLFQEREIHGHKLKAGWTIVVTGNRQSDRAGANRVLGHLSNRMTRVQLEASLDDWTHWALDVGVATEVIAFIRFRPELLSNYDSAQEVNATPRAWVEGVAARMGFIPKELEFSVFTGDVGEGPASEFLAFLRIFRNLPNPDAILLNPKKAVVPKDPATLYALTGALSARATDVNFGAALEYMKRLPPEFCVLFVKDVSNCKSPGARQEPCGKCTPCAITSTREFISWATKEGAGILS